MAQEFFNKIKPYLAIVSLQFGYAGMYIITMISLKQGMSHFVLVVYRHAVATLVIAPFAFFLERKTRPKMTLSVFLKIMALGFVEPVLDQNLYYLGMKYTSATFASATVNVLPALTFILAIIFRLEKVNLNRKHGLAKVIGTAITVTGAMVMTIYKGPIVDILPSHGSNPHQVSNSAASDQHWVKGTIMLLSCTGGWSSFFILQSITLKQYPAELSLTALICLMGMIEGAAVALVMEKDMTAWIIGFDSKLLAAAYSGIVCSGIAYYIQGVVSKIRGPVFVTAFSPLSMIITAILGAIVLAEQIHLGSNFVWKPVSASECLKSHDYVSHTNTCISFVNGCAEDSSLNKRKRQEDDKSSPTEPLWERMRPRAIYEVLGQDHILGEKTLLKSAIDCDRLPSVILWGPPGTGKTSIARAILNNSLSHTYRFVSLSAVTSGVKDIRDAVDGARKMKMFSKKRTVLFIDEVHRFNKSQQDSFLPVIEDGSVIFMGATTENPSFHLITPLLSRCKVLTLNPLGPDHIATLLERAVSNTERGLLKSVVGVGSVKGVMVDDVAIPFLAGHCDGDARVALNALEISATTAAARLISHQSEAENHILVEDDSVSIARVTLEDAKEALQSKHIAYDKTGEEHYNLISALHKSMRGSDANASIYWLARMLEGGEEPLYISRRLIRFASEDIGLADPLALPQAVACYQACHFIGMPECSVCLSQCVAYLALAPKSVSVYKAIEAAKKVVRDSVGQNEGVPLHLRNAPTKLMKELGYGKGYIYPPDNIDSSTQTYLPTSLEGYKFLQ